jgi:hypothetical protein
MRWRSEGLSTKSPEEVHEKEGKSRISSSLCRNKIYIRGSNENNLNVDTGREKEMCYELVSKQLEVVFAK